MLRNEYDLDFVLQLALNTGVDPIVLLLQLEARLRQNEMYAPMVERLNRCVRLNYAGQFHMDILVAVPDGGGTRIAVPDRSLRGWKSSDPKAYAGWFDNRGKLIRFDKAAQIAPLPSIQSASQKTVLQRVVQLSKRNRDLHSVFVNDPDLSPRSIVLTTLEAQCYSGHASTVNALCEVVHAMRDRVADSAMPFEVRNPVNDDEVLSEQWSKKPAAYREFGKWLDVFARDLEKLVAATGLAEIRRQLAALFGETIATDAILKHAARVDDLRKAGDLKVTASGALVTGASTAAAVITPNTFYGDDD